MNHRKLPALLLVSMACASLASNTLPAEESTARTLRTDRTAPLISAIAPDDGKLVYSSPVRITGQIADVGSGIATVNCDNIPAQLSGGTFTCDVALEPGHNRVRIWATDRAKNVASVRQRVVLGPALPGGDAHQVRVISDINGDVRADLVRTDFLSGEVVIAVADANDGGYQAERRIAVGAYPSSVAVADVNGDGVPDLITTHYTSGEVHIQYGQRDGNFVPGPHIQVGAFPAAVIVADIDGNGRADLVTAHMHRNSVHVHLAKGDGTYAEAQHVHVGDGPVALAIGDVNGDGIADIVTANFASGDVSLLLAKSAGHYRSERRIALGPGGASTGPSAIALLDANGDGLTDIVTANFKMDSVTIVAGGAQGTFQSPQSMSVGHQPIALITRDLNADGRSDLITYNAGSQDYSLLTALPDGRFSSAQTLQTLSVATFIITPHPMNVGAALPPAAPSDVNIGVNATGVFAAPARTPALGLLPPADRIGLTFGFDTSEYGKLLAPNGMSYPPLVAAGRAGMKWLRIDADRSSFANGDYTIAGYAAFVDRLIAAGFSVHLIVTDMRWAPSAGISYPTDFPTDQYLEEYAQFAAQLAAATQRPDRVIFEVWNEPDGFGLFWSPQRTGKNEAALFAKMLTKVTEAIHNAAPHAIVISGGLTSDSASYVDRFLPAYKQEIAGRPQAAVDRFGFHPYPALTETLVNFRRQLDAAGFGAYPIDVTEVGDWYGGREWVARRNAAMLLRATENDIPHTNFWAAVSPAAASFALAGFMDPEPGRSSGCSASSYSDIAGINDYRCHPSMYVVRTFDRVARGRTYQGAYVDSRTTPLPGAVAGDELSGLRLLKFESESDVVVAAYTLDWARGEVAGSGRTYNLTFGEVPGYASLEDGKQFLDPSPSGSYAISYVNGPIYFFFTKSGTPPTHTVNAHTVCADGSAPLRGRVQYWHTVWPTPSPPQVPLDWQSPGPGDAATAVTLSRQLAEYRSNLYVAAEIADNTSVFLPARSATQSGGGPLAATFTLSTFFQPATNMVRINGPTTVNGTFDLEFLAPPEWCTP